jgi:signal transduction histidine kinase
MQSATERMQQFIRDLLTFSRLNAQPLSFQQIDLNNLLTDVLSDLETTIESKQAVLHITPLPTINGDALQLRQLFQNLLSNSLKFMDPNRKPHIQIVPVAVGNRNFPRNGTGSFHAIQILDNGIGFDEQYSDRIFTAFQRLHNRSQYEGTGIGLAIVKRVVELHKGLITATSEPGKGSAFTVYLPS